jgi:thiamine biosynthesis lipoprotein
MRRRTFISGAIGALGLGLSAAAGRGAAPPAGGGLYRGAALAFGTTISVSLLHRDRRQAELAIGEALAAAQRVDRLMSIYSPASQVFRLNRDGVLRHPDAHLLRVLAQARQLSRWSGGAFDVTVQPLWQIFRAAADRAALPSEPERARALALVGWRDLRFDRREVRLRRAGMALTLNGLAQGYAADLALAALRARGVEHALLDTGEFAALGRKSAQRPWTLGIRDPRDAAALAAIVSLGGRCLATSGDYECAFTPDLAHHHIFDTARGDSPAELASVTVAAPGAMLADGLSTAFMAMGGQRARALAARLPGVDLLTIDKRGRRWQSPGFPAA